MTKIEKRFTVKQIVVWLYNKKVKMFPFPIFDMGFVIEIGILGFYPDLGSLFKT